MSSYLDTFRRYLEFEKRYSAHTVEAYLSDVASFLAFSESAYEITDPEMIRHTHVRSWMVELLEADISPRSVNRKLSSVRAFFRLMRKLGRVSSNPLQKVQAPKQKSVLPEVIDEASLQLLQEQMTGGGEDFPAFRDLIVIHLLYGLGLRQAELLGIRIGDIDLAKLQIRVTGKRQKQRIIPFGKDLARVLRDYIAHRDKMFGRGGGELILTDRGKPAYPRLIYRIVHRHLSAVSTAAKRSPHVLRHSYATHMLEAGAGIEAIRELLGHASLAATQIYARTSVERLKKTYRQAHPKA